MNIGILAPDNPHKGLHRDAELLAWALSEGGFKSIEILHLKNIRSDVVSTKSTNSGAPSKWSVSEGVYLDEWLHKLDVLFLSEVFNLGRLAWGWLVAPRRCMQRRRDPTNDGCHLSRDRTSKLSQSRVEVSQGGALVASRTSRTATNETLARGSCFHNCSILPKIHTKPRPRTT